MNPASDHVVERPGAQAGAVCRLTPFQRTMLLWEEVHPYNAAHVVRLRGPADPAALEAALRATARSAGVETLAVDRRRCACRWAPGGEVRLRVIEPAGAPHGEALRRAVSADMDRPFPEEACHPVRWSVLEGPASAYHDLIAVYRHVAADAHSMKTLIGNALSAHAPAGAARPIHPAGADPAAAYPMRHRGLASAASLVRTAGLYARLRRAHRQRERRGAIPATGWRCAEPGPGFLERLRSASRAAGFRLGEVFTAALCAAVAEGTPARRSHPRRRALAIGVVRDLRADAERDLSADFAVHLGQTVLLVEDPDEPDFEKLLSGIARRLRREKESGAFAGPQGPFLALSSARRILRRRRTRAWYRKVFPITAGLTNVRWDAGAFGPASGPVLAYYRVAPPGPALPLVIAPTTLGDRFSVTISHVVSAFSPEDAEAIEAVFLRKLEEFGGRAPAAPGSPGERV